MAAYNNESNLTADRRTNLHLEYDLSKDYLHSTQVKELQKLSLMTTVVTAFMSKEATEEIIKIQPSCFSKSLLMDIYTDKIYDIVKNKLELSYWPQCFVKEVLLTIHLVYSEIRNFLFKINVQDRSEVLNNLVFSWQGTISPRQTFLQVLKNDRLSQQEKFEFSCRYLHDQRLIETYFYDLSPTIRNLYKTGDNHHQLERYLLIYFWIWRITGDNQRLRDFRRAGCLEWEDKDEEVTDIYFVFCFSLKFSNEIGVQYFFENFPCCNFKICSSIGLLLKYSFHAPVGNSLMYLISRLDYDIKRIVLNLDSYAHFVLENLIIYPRWHDTFIRYYSVLWEEVEINNYFLLLSFVVIHLWNMIKIEGIDGKFISILRHFINLIPPLVKLVMMIEEGKNYAKLIAKLLHLEDVESVYSLLSTPRNKDGILDVGNNFSILATHYIDVFVEVFSQCSISFIDKALKMLIKSEKQILDLRNKLAPNESQSL